MWSRLKVYMGRYYVAQYSAFLVRRQLMVGQFLARKHIIELRCKVVLCQTRVRQCLAQKYVQTQSFCNDDPNGALIVNEVVKYQVAAREWVARHLARPCVFPLSCPPSTTLGQGLGYAFRWANMNHRYNQA